MAETPDQYQVLLQTIPTADLDAKRKAVISLLSATASRDPAVLNHLSTLGWLAAFILFLNQEDPELILLTYDAMVHFLETGEKIKSEGGKVNPYVKTLEMANCSEVLEALYTSTTDPRVENGARNLLCEFFGYENGEAE